MALVRVGSHRARSKLHYLCSDMKATCRHRPMLAKGEFYEIPDALVAEARKITGITHVKKDPDEKSRVLAEKMKARMTAGVRGLVLGLGGRELAGYGSTAEFEINTRYGRLRITPFDDWIATQFDKPPQGVYGINDYTGKWNFHASGKGEQKAHDVFEMFSRALVSIVK